MIRCCSLRYVPLDYAWKELLRLRYHPRVYTFYGGCTVRSGPLPDSHLRYTVTLLVYVQLLIGCVRYYCDFTLLLCLLHEQFCSPLPFYLHLRAHYTALPVTTPLPTTPRYTYPIALELVDYPTHFTTLFVAIHTRSLPAGILTTGYGYVPFCRFVVLDDRRCCC